MWTSIASIALGACPTAVPAGELATAIGTADAAFSGMDLAAFDASARGVREDLPCLAEVLPPADAAGVHRVEAYAAFVADDEAGASLAFQAVQAAQPGWALPTSVAPEGHPLRDAWDAAKERAPGRPMPLPPPADGALYVDGRRATTRPSDRPAVLQLVDADGAVEWTAYVRLGDDPPDYATGRALPEDAASRPPVVWLGAAGGTAIASGVLYAAALASRARFDDSGTPYEELGGLRKRTNGLYVASVGTGAAALGLGAVAAVSW